MQAESKNKAAAIETLPCAEWLQEAHEALDGHFPLVITNLIKSYIHIPKKFGGEIVQRKTIPLVSFLVPLPVGELAFSSDRTVHYWSRDLAEITKRSFDETILHLVHLQARVVVIAFRSHLAFVDLDDGLQGKILGEMPVRFPPDPEPEPDAKYVSPFHRASRPAVSVWRVLPLLDGRLAVALNTGFVQVFTRRDGESWWSRRPHRWVTFDTKIQDMVGFEQFECGTVMAYNHADRKGISYHDCVKWQRMITEDPEGDLFPSQTQALLKIGHSHFVSANRPLLTAWSVPEQRFVGGGVFCYRHIYEPLALWHDNMLICRRRIPNDLVLVHWEDANYDGRWVFPMEREMVCAMMDRLRRFIVFTDRELMIME